VCWSSSPSVRSLKYQEESTEAVPVVLVGNKTDSAAPREVSTEEGNALARAMGASLVEVSAKWRFDVDEAFHLAVRLSRKQQAASKEAEHKGSAVVGREATGRGHKHRRCEIL